MGFSEIIGRRVRLGDWQDQKISTYRKIHEALDDGRFEDASELAAYFVDEGKVCWVLYRQWILDLEGFLRDEGVTADELAAITEQIESAIVLPTSGSTILFVALAVVGVIVQAAAMRRSAASGGAAWKISIRARPICTTP